MLKGEIRDEIINFFFLFISYFLMLHEEILKISNIILIYLIFEKITLILMLLILSPFFLFFLVFFLQSDII